MIQNICKEEIDETDKKVVDLLEGANENKKR